MKSVLESARPAPGGYPVAAGWPRDARGNGAPRSPGSKPSLRPLGYADLAAWVRRHPEYGSRSGGPRTAWRLERAGVELLRLAPEKRLTASCRMTLAGPAGETRRFRLIAKQYARLDLARRLARYLHTLRFGPSEPGVRIPRLLGLDARRGIVFMETLPGSPLEPELSSPGAERALHAAGALLATFHRGSAEVEKRVTRADELARTRACAAVAAQSFPELAPRLSRLRAALHGLTWGRGDGPVLLHGSFRPSHLMRFRGGLSLFDLESLRYGPAGYDLANWVAALHYHEAERRITAPARRRANRALLRGYTGNGGDESCARVLWLVANLLIQKQLFKYATRAREGGRERAFALVARAEDLVERASSSGAARLDRLEELLP